ncbi:MAG: ribose 5-phosphate isomerase B [Bacteroidetes bacterium]|nr:ribose 5-phosphate isomerase B [Bacteroidota bacterium]
MKYFIASDHAGFQMKKLLFEELLHSNFETEDLGTWSEESTDYSDYAQTLSASILKKPESKGILLCGSGIGMSIAANRFKGIRAALVWNEELAKLSRLHNNSNVLVLPARFLSENQAKSILHTWIETQFEGGRHERRIQKIESDLPTS